MKTKLIILAAAASVLLFSCTSDRNDEEPIQPNTTSKAINVEKLKINNREETSREGDTIVAPPNVDVFLPDNPDNDKIIPPGDVRPPKN